MTVYTSMTPSTILGDQISSLEWECLDWIQEIPGKVYYALWLTTQHNDLPAGYDTYIVYFLGEPLDYPWLYNQFTRFSESKFIVFDNGPGNETHFPDNVYYYRYPCYDLMLGRIVAWHPDPVKKDIQYKVSAICNRITPSKMFAITSVLENFAPDERLIRLSTWLEKDNPDYVFQDVGIDNLDSLKQTFVNKYYGTEIKVDSFAGVSDHTANSNPHNPFYTQAAIHIDLESHALSLMHEDFGINHVRPGPHISEKTFKCLISETAFIPVAQYNLLNYLTMLGFNFDYSDIDLSFDLDAGNLTRANTTAELIASLANWDIADIINATQYSCQHNREHIFSNGLARICSTQRNIVQQQVMKDHT